jgi:hypothetical protein
LGRQSAVPAPMHFVALAFVAFALFLVVDTLID